MNPQQPPDDALLWRVETDHTEVVCLVGRRPTGGVALCVERNELMVAESRLPGASRGALPGASRCTWSDWTAGRGERLTPSRLRRVIAFAGSRRAAGVL